MRSSAPATSAPPITVATYNIHGCVGTDRRFDLPRVAEAIRALDADVIALQEVGDVRGRGPAGDYAAELAHRTGLEVIYQPTMLRGERAYGNAILTRFPVVGSRSYDLSYGRREPRGCIRADLVVDGRRFHVFDVHLGLSRREQRAQAGRLLGADIVRGAAIAWPIVVMGDFNFWFPGPIARMVRRELTDVAAVLSAAQPSYPSRRPFLRLDRIYVDDAWIPLDCRVVRTPLTERASDHLPLVARLRLRPGAPPPPGAEEGEVRPAERPVRGLVERDPPA